MTVQLIADSGADLTPEQFYDRMRRARHLPKTSQPTPHALQASYREALERGPVIGIHVSSALGGTWQSASMAARELNGSIQVFDSRTGSGGMAMMVMEAAAMARDGAGTGASLLGVKPIIAVMPDGSVSVADRVRGRFGPKELVMMPIGATIGSHAAEGAILLSY